MKHSLQPISISLFLYYLWSFLCPSLYPQIMANTNHLVSFSKGQSVLGSYYEYFFSRQEFGYNFKTYKLDSTYNEHLLWSYFQHTITDYLSFSFQIPLTRRELSSFQNTQRRMGFADAICSINVKFIDLESLNHTSFLQAKFSLPIGATNSGPNQAGLILGKGYEELGITWNNRFFLSTLWIDLNLGYIYRTPNYLLYKPLSESSPFLQYVKPGQSSIIQLGLSKLFQNYIYLYSILDLQQTSTLSNSKGEHLSLKKIYFSDQLLLRLLPGIKFNISPTASFWISSELTVYGMNSLQYFPETYNKNGLQIGTSIAFN